MKQLFTIKILFSLLVFGVIAPVKAMDTLADRMNRAMPTQGLTQEQIQDLKIKTYIFNTVFEAGLTGMQAAQQAAEQGASIPGSIVREVTRNFAEGTIMDLVRTGVNKTLGCERQGPKEMVNWGIELFRRGIYYRLALPKKYSKGWVPNYFFNMFLPSFGKSMVCDLVQASFVRGTGIDYPAWVKKRWLVYMFALEIPRFAHQFLHTGCDLVYSLGDFFDKKIKLKRKGKIA